MFNAIQHNALIQHTTTLKERREIFSKRLNSIFSHLRSPQSLSGIGRSRPMIRGMSRSTTACSNLAKFTSPNYPAMVSRGKGPEAYSPLVSRAKTPIRTRVTAIIETSSGRQCVTPPPYPAPLALAPCPTPPNTAPLPKKTVSPLSQTMNMASQFSSQSSCLSQASILSQKTGSSDSVSQKYSNSPSKPPSKPLLETHFGPMSVDSGNPASPHKNIPRGHTRFIERNFSKVSSSACSSVLSSMESMESNTSEGKDSSITII